MNFRVLHGSSKLSLLFSFLKQSWIFNHFFRHGKKWLRFTSISLQIHLLCIQFISSMINDYVLITTCFPWIPCIYFYKFEIGQGLLSEFDSLRLQIERIHFQTFWFRWKILRPMFVDFGQNSGTISNTISNILNFP